MDGGGGGRGQKTASRLHEKNDRGEERRHRKTAHKHTHNGEKGELSKNGGERLATRSLLARSTRRQRTNERTNLVNAAIGRVVVLAQQTLQIEQTTRTKDTTHTKTRAMGSDQRFLGARGTGSGRSFQMLTSS